MNRLGLIVQSLMEPIQEVEQPSSPIPLFDVDNLDSYYQNLQTCDNLCTFRVIPIEDLLDDAPENYAQQFMYTSFYLSYPHNRKIFRRRLQNNLYQTSSTIYSSKAFSPFLSPRPFLHLLVIV